MEKADCAICGPSDSKKLFDKQSPSGESFTLAKCKNCGLEFVDPRPSPEEIAEYYSKEYFTKRTDRGYNNYFSPELKKQITSVLELNLSELGFFEYEASLSGNPSVLDIGCAAGYSVEYMKNRGWSSMGIDISGDCIDYAVSQGLDVIQGSYPETEFESTFDAVTLWATIEHLHYPGQFLEKISRDLKKGGMMYLSTCRAGFGFKTIAGKKWRFYNFPEHLYFFSGTRLKNLLRKYGFSIKTYRTYGSGFAAPGSLTRTIADSAAKKLLIGDMMIISAENTGKD